MAQGSIREELQCRDTDALLAIWSENDRTVWTDAAFEAVQAILKERGVELPPQDAVTEEGQQEDGEVQDGSEVSMEGELRAWGLGLIGMGIISIVLAGWLDPVWGAILIVLGVGTLAYKRAGMFIVIGLALVLVGIMNIAAGGGWTVFGFFQIYWGIQEIGKAQKYAPAG